MDEQQNPPPQAQLVAQPATVRATIHVTRAATGKVDTYELVGTALPPAPQEQNK